MPMRLALYLGSVVFLLSTGTAVAQSATPNAEVVSSISSWPQAGVLKRGDKLQVTTIDLPGVPFPCKVKAVTPDQLVCGKAHQRQTRAFDRKSVQSIILQGHVRHRTSLLLYASSAGLLIGGLACVAAGGSVVCSAVLTASIAAFIAGQVADHEETRSGPTDARTIYIAPADASAGAGLAAPLPIGAEASSQNFGHSSME